MLLREANRLRAGASMFVDRLPGLIWAVLFLIIIAFWGLAGVGAVTVWQGLMG